ncbi:hypothetical protein DFQ30_002701 [Apophysomyces sp. BC1015]|nr:hypothetical protein DFQ30_002701 [Apophysomyces sp. BC1015]
MPRGWALGVTWQLPEHDRVNLYRDKMLEEIAILFGGRVAEEVFLNSMSTGASNDFERATKMARDMVTRYGMSDVLGTMVYIDTEQDGMLGRLSSRSVSEATQQKVDAEIRRILDEQYALARKLLEDNREKVESMVKALLEWETIDADQINDIMSGNDPRPPKNLPPPSGDAPSGSAGPASGATLQCGRFKLTLARPLVMGILNVTPDSFSDSGRFIGVDAARARAGQMIDEGADLIDIGGESTRPGAPPVPLEEELARVLPLIDALRDTGVPISVDTYKPDVMRAVLDAGADLINDIWGLRQPGAIDAVRDARCGLCVMHMLGEPRTMQREPQYRDVVADVRGFLEARIRALLQAGVAAQRLCVDPGFGFGKTLEHNFRLLRELPDTAPAGVPILIGLSRKSMIGAATGRAAPRERVAGSIAGMLAAVERGAAIVRVHDVAPTLDALKVWQATRARP